MLSENELRIIKSAILKMKESKILKDNPNAKKCESAIDELSDRITARYVNNPMTTIDDIIDAINTILVFDTDDYINELLSYIDKYNSGKIPKDEYDILENSWLIKISTRIYKMAVK